MQAWAGHPSSWRTNQVQLNRLAHTARMGKPRQPVKRALSNCLLLAFLAVSLLSGCGRPATVQDCEQIVARVTELELKQASITDPAIVQEQVANSKAAFQDQAMAQCVGKRVTTGFMDCIARASTADQLLKECLN
jgi:hypothetical protein